MSQRNIARIYSMATPEEIAGGSVWYIEAQKQCQLIAKRLSLPLATVAGVVAALSPNNKWERNIINAEELCEAYLAGDAVESVKVSTYHAMKDKAWAILSEGPSDRDTIIAQLKGQKIVAFFRCIMGENTCCVDGHAHNIWRDERNPLSGDKSYIGAKLYRTIAADYAKAGAKLGKKAYEIQAITWVVWRRIHNIK